MHIGITSAVLAIVVCLTAGVTILLRKPRHALHLHFAAFSISLFLWHTAWLIPSPEHVALSPMLAGTALLLGPASIFFYREILRHKVRIPQSWGPISVAVSAALLIALASPLRSLIALRVIIVLYTAFLFFALGRAMYAQMRTMPRGPDRKRLGYILYGGAGAGLLGASELWPGENPMAAVGHVAVTLYVYFLYLSIVAKRLIDMPEILGKAAVVAVLTLILSTVYALLVSWVGEGQPGLLLFNTLVASFVVLILYDQIRPWVENTTAKILFRERYELGQAIRRAIRDLRTTIDVEAMQVTTLNALHSSGRVPNAAIYLPRDSDLVYDLGHHRGEEPTPTFSVASHAVLLKALKREHRPILLEELQYSHQELPAALTEDNPTYRREIARSGEAVAAMQSLNATALIPMVSRHRIVGVLALGQGARAGAYAPNEISSLLSLCEACAVVVKNSHELQKLGERDRLVAIGEMATGMAHEIRNPLGAIKGAAQVIDAEALPPESREFLDVITEEVDRLNGVVEQFLEYARPYSGNPQPTDANDVVLSTLRLLRRDSIPEGIRIEQDLVHALPPVRVDPEQLKQVLINLVLNAVQAMPDGGDIVLRTQVAHLQGAGTDEAPNFDREVPSNRNDLERAVLISVGDNGHGIPADVLSRIFVPFFTTKDHGTGLGLAISQRMIENSGGELEVRTHVSSGTTFTIRFPVHDPATTANQRQAPSPTSDSLQTYGDAGAAEWKSQP